MAKRLFPLMFFMLLITTIVWSRGGQEPTETVNLRFSDNIPDRTEARGVVVERINEEFLARHPEVRIETESMPDTPYQEKIRIYATANQLPDVFKWWSLASFLKPLAETGQVAPLNRADFESFGFLPGALEANEYNGQLYGVPVSADAWVIYYNQAILDECGVDPPETLEELYAAAPLIAAKGYTPMVTAGMEGWPLSIVWDNIFLRQTGDFQVVLDALDGKNGRSFTDPEFVDAARETQKFFRENGLFGRDLTTLDYGAARNLFGQEQAAMYVMGSWELGLAADSNFSESFRENVRAMKFPGPSTGVGSIDQLVAWYGGNYMISASSEHIELANEYLKLFAEMYPKLIWEQQAAFPAQTVEPTANDSPVARDLLGIVADAEFTTGVVSQDYLTPAFSDANYGLARDLAAGVVTPEEFCERMDQAARAVR
jgi:raffinose/stachyose/melibiose transport system substrate-binding protein